MGDLPSPSSPPPPPTGGPSLADAPEAEAHSVVRQTPANGAESELSKRLSDDDWRPRVSLPASARYVRFELLGRLARGGMAEILLARETSAGGGHRYVVVKRILPQSADDEDFVKMFLSEGRLMMGLSHPNVCHVYDVGQQGDTWFIAMEWVHGQTLAKTIRRARARGVTLPAPLAARMIADVAAALHHAHGAKDASGRKLGLVHRDVSPHNVMVAYDGTVKLLDFGVAKVTTSSEHTSTGVVKGKFAYMAPEQCLGKPLDARADVFALGICLYEALTGRALYRRANEYETLSAVIKEPVPSIRDVDPRLPEALDGIVRRALQKKRDDRFDSALAMELALEKYLADERHLVSTALIGRMMRRLFADEIRQGPSLEPLAVHAGVDEPPASDEAADDESVVVEVSSHVTHTSSLRRAAPGRALIAAVFALACLAGAAAWVAWSHGALHVASTEPAPPPPSAAAEPDVANGTVPSATPDVAVGTVPDETPGVEAEPREDPAGPVPVVRAEEARPGPREGAGDEAGDERRTERAWARLSLNTRPWSKVYLRGRLLGTTPLGDVRVPAGRVRLRFEDRDGRVHHRTLRLAPDQRAERFIDFSAASDPRAP